MKRLIIGLLILTSFSVLAAHAQEVKTILTKTQNDKTKMLELCKTYSMYSSDKVQTRDCYIGVEELGGNFHISHFEQNSRIYGGLVEKNDLTKICKDFGYSRAFYRILDEMKQDSAGPFESVNLKNRIRLQLNIKGQESQFFYLSDVTCMK